MSICATSSGDEYIIQSQDTTGGVATNDPPQSIYPDNPEWVRHVFLLGVHCVCCLILHHSCHQIVLQLSCKQYEMSSDFAMNVSIVIVDVTPTADMAKFSLESLRKHASPSIRDNTRRFSNRRKISTVFRRGQCLKLTSLDFVLHY
jgi:hypothetical protein